MKSSRLFFFIMFFAATLSQGALAANDPNAAVVKLRTSCEEVVGGITLNNCFTSMSGASGLQNWIDGRTATTPLIVEIGPGTFGGFACNEKNNISLNGSGPAQTILSGSFSQYGINARNCVNFNVQDLSVVGEGVAVVWNGGGSSRWTNVAVGGKQLFAWYDGNDANTGGCPKITDANKPVHYWFNSRLRGKGVAYAAFCSENWFFGSEIMSTGRSSISPDASIGLLITASFPGANTTARPEAHVYGSVIRVKLDPGGITYPIPGPGGGVGQGLMAVVAGKNADVHIHGTGIDVIGNESPNNIAALAAWDGGTIHANEAAYNLKTATGGTVTRILMDMNPTTDIHASYLWGQYPTPQHPNLPNITSVTGADTAVVTSGTLDGRPHLVIYDKTCTTNTKWYDPVDKRCLP